MPGGCRHRRARSHPPRVCQHWPAVRTETDLADHRATARRCRHSRTRWHGRAFPQVGGRSRAGTAVSRSPHRADTPHRPGRLPARAVDTLRSTAGRLSRVVDGAPVGMRAGAAPARASAVTAAPAQPAHECVEPAARAAWVSGLHASPSGPAVRAELAPAVAHSRTRVSCAAGWSPAVSKSAAARRPAAAVTAWTSPDTFAETGEETRANASETRSGFPGKP